ncbi:MAG: ribonuclease E activity regulator RraA [Methylococcales bacterium]|nr:ribonuclease E activity regulator RraA [Methylococcales bacterium]
MNFTTARLCDCHASSGHVQIAEPVFSNYGATTAFSGQIQTLKLFEDHGLIAQTLAEAGCGRVLVIDGGGSHRCALLGWQLVQQAVAQGWEGLIVYGCVRDSVRLKSLPIALLALQSHPLYSVNKGDGERGVPVTFANIQFRAGHYLYADTDGLLVSEAELSNATE